MIKYKVIAALAATVWLSACQSNNNANLHPESAIVEAETTAAVQTLSSEQAKELLHTKTDIVVLDVRTLPEYQAGHLQSAKHLDYLQTDFEEKVKTLDPSKTYLVYCAVGGRSKQAVAKMRQLGFQHLLDASEGFAALKGSGIKTNL